MKWKLGEKLKVESVGHPSGVDRLELIDLGI